MSFKSMFIKDGDDNKETSSSEQKKPESKFPTESTSKFPSGNSNSEFPSFQSEQKSSISPIVASSDLNPYLDKTIEVYENGLAKLNQPGYDFFEFFKSVTKGGVDNPQVYEMALEMAKGMGANITKELLMSQAEFYISEINKAYNGYLSEGNKKKNDLQTQKESENQNLSAELSTLKSQLQTLQSQINNFPLYLPVV